MGVLKLNDILGLTEQEINDSKVSLNMEWNGTTHFSEWYNSDPNNRNVDFAYHSHYGDNSSKKKASRNFTKIGQYCFGFVRLEEDPNKWLLVTAGKITSIPDYNHIGTCGYEEIEKYKGLIGRMVIEHHRGHAYSRYVFNLKDRIENIYVSEILANVYEPIKFTGVENVHLDFKTLKAILEGIKYVDYRAALVGVNGIYCLMDTNTGKAYIGSAYNKNGILQRWAQYKDSMHGGNKELIALLDQNDESYFEKYFEYTLLETLPKNVDDSEVIARENYWKEVFKSRSFGYNDN